MTLLVSYREVTWLEKKAMEQTHVVHKFLTLLTINSYCASVLEKYDYTIVYPMSAGNLVLGNMVQHVFSTMWWFAPHSHWMECKENRTVEVYLVSFCYKIKLRKINSLILLISPYSFRPKREHRVGIWDRCRTCLMGDISASLIKTWKPPCYLSLINYQNIWLLCGYVLRGGCQLYSVISYCIHI